jgi:ABC-2 type transport system ATP-binding protein
MQEALLVLESVTRKFGTFTAVENVSMTVNCGEIFALLGPNGAGKTTCMKMAIGTLQPTSGNLTINSFDCFKERSKTMALTGYVPDEPSFPPFIRASELIRFQGEMHGLTLDEIKQNSEPLIERLELGDALNEFAVNYSKGMKKKLAVILALIHQPKLLILDELTNGLDPYATRELHKLMLEKKDEGCAIVFSTHLLDQAEKLCDQLSIIKNGKITLSGSLKLIKGENGDLEQIFFQNTGEDKNSAETVESPAE